MPTTNSSSLPPSSRRRLAPILLTLALPVAISILLYNQLPDFAPAEIPDYSLTASTPVPFRNVSIKAVSERIGDGLLPGPEDFGYDAGAGVLYTSCSDGWIRRLDLRAHGGGPETKVEDWAWVGGRPLGVALGPNGGLLVAEAFKGLLLVTADKEVQLLTDEAEGLKLRIADGVDVATDGTIYFTDASYKYDMHYHMLDVLEGRPYGRLLSFDPSTNQTVVLARDLYFANGVAVSPDQQSVIFCETVVRRCRRYYVHGEKKGMLEAFADNLPGFPDNIRYDGEGHYWIGLAAGRTWAWDMLIKYPFLRTVLAVVGRYVAMSELQKGSGVLSVDLEGKPVALYSDRELQTVTVGLKIGEYLYHGSLFEPYISRIDLSQLVGHPN